MKNQTPIILVVAGAVLLIVLMMIKNKRDRKKLFDNANSTEPVDEQTLGRKQPAGSILILFSLYESQEEVTCSEYL